MEFQKNRIREFSRSKLKYTHNHNGEFIHNYAKDVQFIILWQNGRHRQQDVMEEIGSKFEILYVSEVHWSEENKRANFNRLYSQPMDSNQNLKKHLNVGMGPFLCIVFEDKEPKYQYLKSLSGDIFIGNINAVRIKYDLRKMLGDNLVHGTSGISEFYHHASLIFHYRRLTEIISLESWDGNIDLLKQDLAGTKGWSTFEEFFTMANLSSNWVVLRNHEYLPDKFWGNDKDIDLLCDDLPRFTSVVNASKRKGGVSAYKTIIEGKEVLLDIRYLGDNYYDPVWQYQILDRKVYKDHKVPIMREDDYFFSLLYHAKLQKSKVKETYVPRLIKLGRKIGFQNIVENDIKEDKNAAKILNGFLNENGYYFHIPHDNRVFLNKSVYKYITAIPITNKVALKNKVITLLSSLIPRGLKRIVPRKVKESIKRM